MIISLFSQRSGLCSLSAAVHIQYSILYSPIRQQWRWLSAEWVPATDGSGIETYGAHYGTVSETKSDLVHGAVEFGVAFTVIEQAELMISCYQ